MCDVLRVPVPVIGVDQHWKITRGDDVPNAGGLLRKPSEIHVGYGMASADQSKSANLVRLKAGALDQSRCERIVRRW